MKRLIKITIIIFIIAVLICTYCLISKSIYKSTDKLTNSGNNKITDINIYRGSPVWDLALAVQDQNVNKIKSFILWIR